MLSPRQLRNLYGATMEALGLMRCSSNEATTTIAESLKHRLRTNDETMRAQATRAFIFQCQQLTDGKKGGGDYFYLFPLGLL
jgi:hypothetical protein